LQPLFARLGHAVDATTNSQPEDQPAEVGAL
jgi:hypothetical protein